LFGIIALSACRNLILAAGRAWMNRKWGLLALIGLGLVVWFLAFEAVVRCGPDSVSATAGATMPYHPESSGWLVVTPTILLAEVPWGERELQQLLIGNESVTATLDYSIIAWGSLSQGAGIVPWLRISPTAGSILAGSRVTVSVTFVTTETWVGPHFAEMLISSENVEPMSVTVPVFLEVIEGTPELVVTPTTLSADLPAGATTWQTFTVGNEGNATLLFTLTLPSGTELATVPWLEVSPVAGAVAPGSRQVVTAVFDSSGQRPGTYSAPLVVESNSQLVPSVTMAISLTVKPMSVYVPAVFKAP
jgi:hypothetical protein